MTPPMTPFRGRKVKGQDHAVTENHPYLRYVKAYKLPTWYTDGVRCATSPTFAVTSSLKALDDHITLH